MVAYNPRDKGDEPLEIGKELTIDDETFTFRIGLAGTGFKGMSWSTNQLLELVQDTDNPYLFTAECIAEDKGSFECTITPYDPFGNKWLEPYWRWNGSWHSYYRKYYCDFHCSGMSAVWISYVLQISRHFGVCFYFGQ